MIERSDLFAGALAFAFAIAAGPAGAVDIAPGAASAPETKVQTVQAAASPDASKVDAGKVDVADLLFDARHFKSTAPDAKIRYTFRRESADPARGMPSFKDEIDFQLEPGKEPDKRNVVVTLFKGEQHRAAGPFDDVAFNPITMLVLEFDVGNLAKSLSANPRYLKNAIRRAMRDNAVTKTVEVPFGGRRIQATEVDIKPFADDQQNRERFGPFLGTTYRFVVSDQVPGSIYSISIVTPDKAENAPPVLLEELKYAEN